MSLYEGLAQFGHGVNEAYRSSFFKFAGILILLWQKDDGSGLPTSGHHPVPPVAVQQTTHPAQEIIVQQFKSFVGNVIISGELGLLLRAIFFRIGPSRHGFFFDGLALPR